MAWMSDEQYEYVQDCKEKSVTARSARNKKTHTGKGGAVRLPSDNLTKKEREAMNGACIKYASLKKPMTWEEFKALPKDLAVQYIKSLRKKFNVPDKYIALHVFRISPPTLTKYNRSELDLFQGKEAGGHRVWDKEGFLAWCGGVEDGVVKPSETPIEEEEYLGIPIGKEFVDIPEDGLVVFGAGPVIVTPEMESILKELVKDDLKTEEGEHDIDREVFEYNYDRINKIEHKPIEEVFNEHKTVIPECGEMSFRGNVDDILRTISKLLDDHQVLLEVKWKVTG